MADQSTIRTGDTIVIGEDGTARNVDQEAREAVAAEAAKPVESKSKKPAAAGDGKDVLKTTPSDLD